MPKSGGGATKTAARDAGQKKTETGDTQTHTHIHTHTHTHTHAHTHTHTYTTLLTLIVDVLTLQMRKYLLEPTPMLL